MERKFLWSVAVGLVPLLIWISVRWQDILYSFRIPMLGELAGLEGITYMAASLLISARLGFVDRLFGGLDKAYAVHSTFGQMSLIFLLAHPVLLLGRYAQTVSDYAKFLWISGWLEKDAGVVALYSLIAGVSAALFFRFRYELWKMLHKLMYPIFLVGAYHSLFISSSFTSSPIARAYVVSMSATGAVSGLYAVLREYFAGRDALVSGVRKISNGIHEVEFDIKLDFKPGQFVFVKFLRKGMNEWHPFSIVSRPGENLRIAVKSVGDFTSMVGSLGKGDRAKVDGPYGGFTPDKGGRKQLWIAGGIGVTPFVSMSHSAKDVVMYYSVRTKGDLIYLGVLKKNVKVVPVVTSKDGRLTAERIASEVPDFRERVVYLCGPPGMMRSLEKGLRKLGARTFVYERFGMR